MAAVDVDVAIGAQLIAVGKRFREALLLDVKLTNNTEITFIF